MSANGHSLHHGTPPDDVTREELWGQVQSLRDLLAVTQREHTERVAGLRAELDTVNRDHLEASFQLDDATRRLAYLVSAIRSAIPRITHGEYRVAADQLRQARERVGEVVPPLELATPGGPTIPVVGSGLGSGRVKLSADARGLVIHVDDESSGAWWMEMVLSDRIILGAMHEIRRQQQPASEVLIV